MNYLIRVLGFIVLLGGIQLIALAQEGGTISGKVTVSGKALPGAQILVLNPDKDSRNGRIAKAETDIEGQYKVTIPKPGTYLITPLTPAYPFTLEQSYYRGGKTVTISQGDEIKGIDFSFQNGGVITGHIIGFDSKPLINTVVSIRKVEDDGKKTTLTPINPLMNRTDDRGVYRFYGIPPGKYIISVGAKPDANRPNFSSSKIYIPLTYYPSVAQEAAAQVIEVKEGKENNNIDITAQRPATNFRITGKVIDGLTGKPAEGLGVYYAKYVNDQPVPSFSGIKTNARGEFQVNGLNTGKYIVMGINYLNVEAYKDFYSDKTQFEIGNEDVNNLEVKLFKGATINGTVAVDKLSGSATPSLTNFQISMRDINGRGLVAPNNTKINDDGSFILRGVSPGEFRFSLLSNERNNVRVLGVETPNGRGNSLTISGNEQINGVRILVGVGTAIIRGEVKINGTIAQNSYIYVVGALEGQTPQTASYNQPIDTRNKFTISDVVAGTYEISAYYYSAYDKPPIRSDVQKINVTEGLTTDVTLTLNITNEDQPKEGEQK